MIYFKKIAANIKVQYIFSFQSELNPVILENFLSMKPKLSDPCLYMLYNCAAKGCLKIT